MGDGLGADDLGTDLVFPRCQRVDQMTEPLPLPIETSVQIAWDYLERSDEHGDIAVASRFLVGSIELLMVRRGKRRRLLFANKAIDQYRRFINHDSARAREGRLHG